VTSGELVAVLALVALVTASVWVNALIDAFRLLRHQRSATKRADIAAKYRHLGLISAIVGGAFFLLLLPAALLGPKNGLPQILGTFLALLFLWLVPKPAAPAAPATAIPEPPAEGQGIVMTRQLDSVFVVAFTVFVDQQRHGAIRAGQTRTYVLPPGVHTVALKAGRGSWGRTSPEAVTIEPGLWCRVECGAQRAFPGLAEFVHPEQRIWIRADSTPLRRPRL
jgi:hypothetical protein